MDVREIENIFYNSAGDIKNQLSRTSNQLLNTQQQMLILKDEQTEIYQQLAKLYLLESPNNDIGKIKPLTDKLKEQFKFLERQHQELEKQIFTYQDKVSAILTQIDDAVIKKEQLLNDDPQYLSLLNEFNQVDEALQKETSVYQDHQTEFSQKLAQYSQNSCYNYLIKRKFAQDSYSGWWIFRNLDRWAARYVNFTENYKNQKMLEALLQESQNRYQTKQQSYQSLREQIEKKNQSLDLQVKLPELNAELTQIEQQLTQYQDQKNTIYQELNDNKQGNGTLFLTISNQLAAIMQQQSISTLKQLAQQTATQEDDLLLAKLPTIAENMQRLESTLAELQQQNAALERNYQRVNQVVSLFRQKNIPSYEYDYVFSRSHINQFINKLLVNAMSPENIIEMLLRNRKRVIRAESSSTIFPPINRSRSSSSNTSYTPNSWGEQRSNRGGFSSSSSVGGGGFKSTDSF